MPTKNLDSTVSSALLLVIICGLNLRCNKLIYYLLHRIQTQKSHSCLTFDFFFFFFFFLGLLTLILPFTNLVMFIREFRTSYTKRCACVLVVLERETEREREATNNVDLRHINFLQN